MDVLYEDGHLLIVSKPAGLVVHPTYKNKTGTLLDILLADPDRWPADARPSIVGRLDKLTSGIVVVAKTAAMHAALQRAWASRDAEKDYLAVVYGRVSEPSGTIDLRLRHDPVDRRMMVVSNEGEAPPLLENDGMSSVTRFERLAAVDAPRAGLSLLRCRLVTGRRHQIRVHLAARGWPIIGDPQYGEPRWSQIDEDALAATLQAFPRQALHAWRVAFAHPITRERVAIEAPVPRDLVDLMEVIGFSAALKGPPHER
jgi:23S rRNA pseudouridine1911/1915/1917 synthase